MFLFCYNFAKQPRDQSKFFCFSSAQRRRFLVGTIHLARKFRADRKEPIPAFSNEQPLDWEKCGAVDMKEIFVEISEVKRVEPERERCRSSRSIQLPRHLKNFNIDFNIQARPTAPNTELF